MKFNLDIDIKGPSGSGKTTLSQMLRTCFDRRGTSYTNESGGILRNNYGEIIRGERPNVEVRIREIIPTEPPIGIKDSVLWEYLVDRVPAEKISSIIETLSHLVQLEVSAHRTFYAARTEHNNRQIEAVTTALMESGLDHYKSRDIALAKAQEFIAAYNAINEKN